MWHYNAASISLNSQSWWTQDWEWTKMDQYGLNIPRCRMSEEVTKWQGKATIGLGSDKNHDGRENFPWPALATVVTNITFEPYIFFLFLLTKNMFSPKWSQCHFFLQILPSFPFLLHFSSPVTFSTKCFLLRKMFILFFKPWRFVSLPCHPWPACYPTFFLIPDPIQFCKSSGIT